MTLSPDLCWCTSPSPSLIALNTTVAPGTRKQENIQHKFGAPALEDLNALAACCVFDALNERVPHMCFPRAFNSNVIYPWIRAVTRMHGINYSPETTSPGAHGWGERHRKDDNGPNVLRHPQERLYAGEADQLLFGHHRGDVPGHHRGGAR